MIEIKHNKLGFNKEFVEGFARLFFEDTMQKKKGHLVQEKLVIIGRN